MPENKPESSIKSLDPAFAASERASQLDWHSVRGLTLEGRGWDESALESPYDRLPARAKATVREPVWRLSHHSAGLAVRFVTDAPFIEVRWSLRQKPGEMDHMPRTGADGLDVYAKEDGQWRFADVARGIRQMENQAALCKGIQPGQREYLVHLPLYNGVNEVEVGIPEDAAISPAPARSRSALVCYGTSIVQGGCASRPGMAYPAMLGRRLDREVYNLGFSGNGKAEPEVADLLAELDPRVYVIDPLPNLTSEQTAQRIEPFVKTLRAARPETPIVLVGARTYGNASVIPERRERCEQSNANLRQAYQRLLDAGVDHLHHVPGETLLGSDDEATVDGSHPTDLGFWRMTEALVPILEPLV